MEQTKTWKNRSKIADSFDFTFDLTLIHPEALRDLYETRGLSAAQIGKKLGAPKATILCLLHSHGIRCKTPKGRSTRPDNYRAPSPPYGFKVRAGKLIEDAREQNVIRLIVRLAESRGLNWTAVAEELNHRKIPTKRGRGAWHRHTVRTIFKRWHKKI